MFQQLKLLKDLLGLYLSRQQAMALLERVQASNLSDDDRTRVTHILRVMLRLPEDPVPEPSVRLKPLDLVAPTAPSDAAAAGGESLTPS